MTRRAALALALLVSLAACDTPIVGGLPLATGAKHELLVVSDSATWNGVVGDAVRAELAKPIATLPNQQGAFKLRFQGLASGLLPGLKKTRNVLFVGPISDSTEVARFLRARVPEAQREAVEGGRSVALSTRDDLWASGQVVTFATAATDSILARAILDAGPTLRARYDANVLAATVVSMFDAGRQTEVEAGLLADHGFAVNVQHDYLQVQDTTVTALGRTGQFVRFRRVIPETWRDFFVFYQDGVSELPPPDELDRLTDRLLQDLVQGTEEDAYVAVDFRRPVTYDTVRVAGYESLEMRGMWRMVGDLMGGAFIRYAWVDPAQQRLYVYYGMTFAPSRTHDKREFLRQMQAIATTFRTSAAAETTDA